MAEEKRPADADSRAPSEDILNKLGSDWGDDWEAAFQAEAGDEDGETLDDDILALADTDQEDTSSTASPAAASQAAAGDTTTTGQARRWRLPPLDLAAGLALLLSLPERARTRARALPTATGHRWRWFSKLSGAHKLIVINLILLLLLLTALLLRPGEESAREPGVVLPADPFGVEAQTGGQPLFAEEPAPRETAKPAPQEAEPPPAEPPTPQPLPEAATPEPAPASQRHTLELDGFLIPLGGEGEADSSAFLQLELTLRLQLTAGEEPDPLLTPVLRDSIYKFYRQQNRETLRRYTLARGDMLRELRQWLDGQHPELAIETIAFDRYWIN
ncbi:MAG: hypothetical protein U5J62_11090 [Desulfurivibrio sp.]|nr:hypothetical protein [Desulfurivibrio sp.]